MLEITVFPVILSEASSADTRAAFFLGLKGKTFIVPTIDRYALFRHLFPQYVGKRDVSEPVRDEKVRYGIFAEAGDPLRR